jgi:multiple sugar transport system permease protein
MAKRLGIHGLLVIWSAICLFPIYWVAIASFKDASGIDSPASYLPFIHFAPTLEAWRFILADAQESLVPRAANSLIIGVSATLATLMVGGMAAYGVTRFGRRARGIALMDLLLGTRILPPVVIALPLYVMAQSVGMLDTRSVLVLVYTAINLPIAIWMLAAVFGERATDQEEAASLEGASHLHIFFFILLPMVKTAIITVGLLIFIQCWNEYLFAAYLTSDHALTIPPWMVGQVSIKEAQTGGGSEDLAHLVAATLVMALPVLMLTIMAARSVTRLLRPRLFNNRS